MKLTKDKYCCLSDLHLVPKNPICRLDDLVEEQWKKLDQIYKHAALRNADVILAGDAHAVSNDYSVLARLSEFLKKWQDLGVQTWAVYGQHDMKYRNPENTNMDILVKSGLINIIPREGICEGGVRICGCGWMEDVPEPDATRINILVIHAPISPKALFHGHNYIDAWAFMYEHPFDITICGDVHRTFIEENEGHICLNSGPLLRREADEYSFTHRPGFWFLNLDEITFDFIEIKYNSSQECLTRAHISKSKEKKESFDEANTSKFLYELKTRTDAGKLMKIEERMKARIQSKDSGLGSETKEIIETLMNGKSLDRWLNENTKIKRVK